MPNRPRGVAGNPSKVQTLNINFLLLLSDPIRIIISCIKGCSKVATAWKITVVSKNSRNGDKLILLKEGRKWSLIFWEHILLTNSVRIPVLMFSPYSPLFQPSLFLKPGPRSPALGPGAWLYLPCKQRPPQGYLQGWPRVLLQPQGSTPISYHNLATHMYKIN